MQSSVLGPVSRLTGASLMRKFNDGFSVLATRSPRQFSTSTKQDNSSGHLSGRMLSTLSVLGRLFTRQANVYIYNRVRKVLQLHDVYRNDLSPRRLFTLAHSLLRRLSRERTSLFLLGAAGFSFKHDGITDDDVKLCIDEFEILKRPASPLSCTKAEKSDPKEDVGRLNLDQFKSHLREEGFEPVVDSERLHIWRKREPNRQNYTYKVYGTFVDVPARAFFKVQVDTDYRKKWDELVVQLDIIDKDNNNDVIYWLMHYPFPLRDRDYVFIRRSFVDLERSCMVVVCHGCTHPDRPPRKDVVRVDQYMSNMVISPHNSFDENGFDYLLTYYDDPQSSFPSPVYAWMAASGVHDYVDKLHNATKRLHKDSMGAAGGAGSATTALNFTATQQPQSQFA